MKKWSASFLSLTLMLAFANFTLSSCEQDPCSSLQCQNQGSCADGYCQCPEGYEGAECENAVSDRFVGSYLGTSKCDNSLPQSETVTISLVEKPNHIAIELTLDGAVTELQGTIQNGEIKITESDKENLELYVYATLNGNFLNIYSESKNSSTNKAQVCSFTGTRVSDK